MGHRLLVQLATGQVIRERAAVVVAHPDDETIGLGGRLNRFEDLLLIHITNGAPLDMGDSERAGFSTAQAYAAARERELQAALGELGGSARRRGYAIADQTAVDHLCGLTERLLSDLAQTEIVITHAYEGGHPDHDACALAVQFACAGLGPRAPVRLEFAGYHAEHGAMAVQRFWPDHEHPAAVARLSAADRGRKARAFAAYATQAEVLSMFDPAQEAYRSAPLYDFTVPPPPGAYLYDGFGFGLTGRLWSQRARTALAQLTTRVTG